MSATDEDRFTRLYHDTSPRVYAYLRRHADPDDAEAVLADVYVKAWKHLAGLDDEPMGWLIATARTTMLDLWRSQKRRRRLENDVRAVTTQTSEAGVDGVTVDRVVMLNALQALTTTDREALLLVGWEGLDHTSAAEVAGCSVSAFTARINRARGRLARLLESEQGGSAPTSRHALNGAS